MTKAKLFWNGRSQAVRLPKAFRFEGEEVSISRVGDTVVLKPVAKVVDGQPAVDQWAWLDDLPKGGFDQDAIDAMEEWVEPQERPEVDELFK